MTYSVWKKYTNGADVIVHDGNWDKKWRFIHDSHENKTTILEQDCEGGFVDFTPTHAETELIFRIAKEQWNINLAG